MDTRAAPPFRPYLQIISERSCPEPIFVVAFTGTRVWQRLEVPTEVLILSPSQRRREIGKIILAHHAKRQPWAGPFGPILGYALHTLPDRVVRYDVVGNLVGGAVPPVNQGVVSLRLR